jgi:transposase-like protein
MSHNIIQKGLAFLCEQSGTVTVSRNSTAMSVSSLVNFVLCRFRQGIARVEQHDEGVRARRASLVRVIDKLRGLRLAKAVELAEAAVEETLTYYAFPEEHWRRIRTNNPLGLSITTVRVEVEVRPLFRGARCAVRP